MTPLHAPYTMIRTLTPPEESADCPCTRRNSVPCDDTGLPKESRAETNVAWSEVATHNEYHGKFRQESAAAATTWLAGGSFSFRSVSFVHCLAARTNHCQGPLPGDDQLLANDIDYFGAEVFWVHRLQGGRKPVWCETPWCVNMSG